MYRGNGIKRFPRVFFHFPMIASYKSVLQCYSQNIGQILLRCRTFMSFGEHTFFPVFPAQDSWQTSGCSRFLLHWQFVNAVISVCGIYSVSFEIAFSPFTIILWCHPGCCRHLQLVPFHPSHSHCITVFLSVLQSPKVIWVSVGCYIHSCVCCLCKYKVLVVWNKNQEKSFQVMQQLNVYLVFGGPARTVIRMPLPLCSPQTLYK